MARNSTFAVRDGKSDTARKMAKKNWDFSEPKHGSKKNFTRESCQKLNEKILAYLEKEIRENLHFVKNSGKKHRTKKQNSEILNWVQEDLEFLRKLRKYYKNPETEKLSREEKNRKMEIEIEFMYFGMKSDKNWDRMFTENLRDIRKPCRSPKFYKDYFMKLLKWKN